MTNPKVLRIDLLEDVVTVYDQTKTTILGRVFQKTLNNSKVVLGPPLTKFIDVFTDTGVVPAGPMHLTENGRLFILGAYSGGLADIILYTLNLPTLAHQYIGRVRIPLPNSAATTHTFRMLKAFDTGTTGWNIWVGTTASVLINGGQFRVNKVDLADFVPVGFPTLAFGTGSDQKAVYFCQNPALLGVSHTQTALVGGFRDLTNSRVYTHNGVFGTHQYHVYSNAVAPNNPGQTFTVTIAAPGVVTSTAHGYANNDPVTLSTTGALPTGLVAGTVYFVRNAAANTFELSATSGGASITTTGAQSGAHTVRRAFGISSAEFVHATGNLPALSGTLLAVNNENYHTPTAGPNAGQPCVDLMTASQVYRGRVSELTSGAVTWPSLEAFNLLSSSITAPTATFGGFFETVQKWVYVTNTAKFVQKGDGNNTVDRVFGSLLNRYHEAMGFETVDLGAVTVLGFENHAGHLLISSSTVGQRGVSVMDLRSDADFDYSSVISPVVAVEDIDAEFIATIEGLFESTGTVRFYYRTSGFGSASGGWVEIATAEDLSFAVVAGSIQFKCLFDIALENASTPAQLMEILFGYVGANQISDNWEYSKDKSESGSPTRVAFRLKKAYGASVPTLYFRARDLTNVVVASKNSSADAALFTYSIDNGATWLPLGTIPNTVGTMVRFNFATPPGVDIRVSLREA